jgi:quinol monooxygenase YgiN
MVRVIIERRPKQGTEHEMRPLLHELRSQALPQRGYISGETLVGHDDPSLWVVIATWLSAEHWESWINSRERKELAAKIEPLLTAPTKITVLDFLQEPQR